MHFLKKSLLLLPLLSLFVTSCDDIKEEDRYIIVEQVTPKRAVLLEEFTGQRCRNCPSAHAIIATLKEQYGDAFIPVSIHAGSSANAISASKSTSVTDQGLKQDEGDIYANMWDISSYPQGVLDRTSGVLDMYSWADKIVEEMQKDAPLNFDITAVYDKDSNSVKISTTVEPYETLNGYLQLWLVESNIISRQQNGSKMNYEYEHNHVFRTSINGTQGEAVALNANIYASFTHSVELQEYWQPANLSVVAFVYNNSGVLQACEVAVTQ